jgi:hypothetical protein
VKYGFSILMHHTLWKPRPVMPIRMIAQELYRLLQEVEKVEKQLKNAPFEKHEKIKDQLRKLKAERNRVRAILEGKKEHKPRR